MSEKKRERGIVLPNMKESNNSFVMGRNPVAEALKNGRSISRIVTVKNGEGSIKKLVAQAKEKRIPLRFAERNELDRISKGGRHQGIIAFIEEYSYANVDDILRLAEKRGEKPFVVILDNLEDPHNLGAIMRTAECAGVHGIIIGKNRSVSINATAAKTSAGAVEYLPCAKVTNISRTLEELKAKGLWIAACDMDGETLYSADLKAPLGIVIGNEGKGISRLVKEKCDFTVSIPMKGKISSLNAANAAAILMYEVRRQMDA